MTGMIAEIAVLMAHNRSYRSGREIESMALPSTLRQNNSTHPGGAEERENKLRGNWDISVVGWNNGSWELTDKLQIKRIMQILGKPAYGTKTADYTPDITVVSFTEHVRPVGTNLDVIEGLQTLINTTEPKPTRQERTNSVAMSRELRTHIARVAGVRGNLNDATADIYRTERRAPHHVRRRREEQ
jgi:hypothetical protein